MMAVRPSDTAHTAMIAASSKSMGLLYLIPALWPPMHYIVWDWFDASYSSILILLKALGALLTWKIPPAPRENRRAKASENSALEPSPGLHFDPKFRFGTPWLSEAYWTKVQ